MTLTDAIPDERAPTALATDERQSEPEQVKAVLRRRAELLAEEPLADDVDEQQMGVIVFTLAQETYAVEMTYVRETLPLGDVTPLPCTPPFVLGIINLRGRIVSVTDLRGLFELPVESLPDGATVIVLSDGDMEFGVLAETLVGACSIPSAHIQPSLPTLTGVRQDYVAGVTRDRTVVLDAARILSDDRVVVNRAEA